MSHKAHDAAPQASWPILKRLLGYTAGRKKGLVIASIGMAGLCGCGYIHAIADQTITG